MVRTLLIRGMLVGLIAGLLVFAFGRLVGEPQVDQAVAFETAIDEAKAKAEPAKGMHAMTHAIGTEPELVSRDMQARLGLVTGVGGFSAGFGGVFCMVVCVGTCPFG